MSYHIDNKCISCGMCAGECPVAAIREGKGKYDIDPKICVDCGTCESICPVQAISAAKPEKAAQTNTGKPEKIVHVVSASKPKK